ncbi:MAG: hypothetical protein N3F11_07550 [Casimicrobiaceae bacterium]|nr:hypothetical protein [Casimicrobiaceae bacterium]
MPDSAPQLERLCAIDAPARLSFDRRRLLVLHRFATHALLEQRRLDDCRVSSSHPVPLATFDFDASGHYLAVAARTSHAQARLSIIDARGVRRASRAMPDRNVELGFDLTGPVLHNFDRTAAPPRAFSVPELKVLRARELSPDETAIAGTRWRLRRSASGVELHDGAGRRQPLPTAVQQQQPLAVTPDARRLLSYHHDGLDGRLYLVKTAEARVEALAQGLIDAAALSADGCRAAWSRRLGDVVRVEMAELCHLSGLASPRASNPRFASRARHSAR